MFEHDHPIRAINRCLHRLPLILDILDELQTSHDHPGDEDLKHGSHQAVHRMMERLHAIKPLSAADEPHPPEQEIAIAHSWLLGERPRKLLPPSIHAEMSRMIRQLITEMPGIMSGQTD